MIRNGLKRTAGLFLAIAAVATLAANPALAHRFNVTLVVPLSGAAAEQGSQFRQGFMLATTERDAHTDEESDGHLGGLDSYVRVIDARGDLAAALKSSQADIVAIFDSGDIRSRVAKILDGNAAVLLSPGQLPFEGNAMPGDFARAYKGEYRIAPSTDAAWGYNAAQRIDRAVRDQGGVADGAALRRIFAETARNFTW